MRQAGFASLIVIGGIALAVVLGGLMLSAKVMKSQRDAARAEVEEKKATITKLEAERDRWINAAKQCSQATAELEALNKKRLADAQKRAAAALAAAKVSEDRAQALAALLNAPGGSGLECEQAVDRVKASL